MDESFLLMLSNLLHLQNYLDPTTSPLLTTTASPSSSATDPTSSTSFAPLLFFTLASVLSYISTNYKSNKPNNNKPDNQKEAETPSEYSVAAFRALSTEQIWQMEPSLRDAQWRSLYGLSHPVFTTVVEKLKPYITQSQLSLPSDYAVAMVLSRLCHGLSLKTMAKRYALEPYLISKITNMVTRLLATKLCKEFIKIPVLKRRLIEITQGFQEITGFSNVCGAIGTTPVRLRKVGEDESVYVCKYGYPAVLLQVVSDNNKIFWDVCVKAPGGVDDATHFRESLLYNRLISDDVVWEKVVGVRGQSVRPFMVGDRGFPLLSFLMTPYSYNRTGNPAQNAFDEALGRGRRVVGDAIGLLKARWKILQDLNVGIHHVPQTIVACCVLHNLCQIAREPEPELWSEPEESGQVARAMESEKAAHYYGESVRQVLADDLYQRLSSSR